MKNNNTEKNRTYLEKKKKIEMNKWRQLINVILAGIVLYFLLTFNVFHYTGNILGVLLVLIVGQILNLIVKRLFSLFID